MSHGITTTVAKSSSVAKYTNDRGEQRRTVVDRASTLLSIRALELLYALLACTSAGISVTWASAPLALLMLRFTLRVGRPAHVGRTCMRMHPFANTMHLHTTCGQIQVYKRHIPATSKTLLHVVRLGGVAIGHVFICMGHALPMSLEPISQTVRSQPHAPACSTMQYLLFRNTNSWTSCACPLALHLAFPSVSLDLTR